MTIMRRIQTRTWTHDHAASEPRHDWFHPGNHQRRESDWVTKLQGLWVVPNTRVGKLWRASRRHGNVAKIPRCASFTWQCLRSPNSAQDGWCQNPMMCAAPNFTPCKTKSSLLLNLQNPLWRWIGRKMIVMCVWWRLQQPCTLFQSSLTVFETVDSQQQPLKPSLPPPDWAESPPSTNNQASSLCHFCFH